MYKKIKYLCNKYHIIAIAIFVLGFILINFDNIIISIIGNILVIFSLIVLTFYFLYKNDEKKGIKYD